MPSGVTVTVVIDNYVDANGKSYSTQFDTRYMWKKEGDYYVNYEPSQLGDIQVNERDIRKIKKKSKIWFFLRLHMPFIYIRANTEKKSSGKGEQLFQEVLKIQKKYRDSLVKKKPLQTVKSQSLPPQTVKPQSPVTTEPVEELDDRNALGIDEVYAMMGIREGFKRETEKVLRNYETILEEAIDDASANDNLDTELQNYKTIDTEKLGKEEKFIFIRNITDTEPQYPALQFAMQLPAIFSLILPVQDKVRKEVASWFNFIYSSTTTTERSDFSADFKVTEFKVTVNPLLEELQKRISNTFDIDRKKQTIYPLSLSTLMLFFFHTNNIKVLWPAASAIVEKMQIIYDELEEKEVDVLFKNANDYKNGSKKSLEFSEFGKNAMLTFLGCVFLHMKKDDKQISYQFLDQGTDTKRNLTELVLKQYPENVLLDAYKHLCERQENYFKRLALRNKPTVPYVLSDYEEGNLPRLLPMTPQSMKHLEINKDTLDCIPCKKGHERYRGYTNAIFHKDKFDPDNNVAYCVQTLDDLLEELGLQDQKKLPYYVQWVGTAEAAQRRLDEYMKVQQQYFDSNDARYDMVTYYTTLIRLWADKKIKELANYTEEFYLNEKNLEKEISFEDLKEDQDGTWSAYLKEKFATVTNELWKLLKKVLSFAKNVGMVLYKTLTLLVNHPMVMQLLIEYVEKYFNEVCQSISSYETTQELKDNAGQTSVSAPKNGVDMIRSDNEGNVERLSYERGQWYKVSEEEKAKLVAEKKRLDGQVWDNKVWVFYEVLSGFLKDGKWKDAMEDMQALHSQTFTALFDALQAIPLVGQVFKTVGKETVRTFILGYLQDAGSAVLKRVVKTANNIQRVTKLATTFYQSIQIYRGQCDAKPATLWNGVQLGKELTTRFNIAYQNAIVNVPYYAMMILSEEALQRFVYKNKTPNRDVIVQSLIDGTLVGGSPLKQDKLNQVLEEDRIKQRFQKLKEILAKYTKKGSTFEGTVQIRNFMDISIDDQKAYDEEIKTSKSKKTVWYMVAGVGVALAAAACYANPACAAGASAVATGVSAYLANTKAAKVGFDIARSLGKRWDQIKSLVKEWIGFVYSNGKFIKEKGQAIIQKIADKTGVSFSGVADALKNLIFDKNAREMLMDFAPRATLVAAEPLYKAGIKFYGNVQDWIDSYKAIPLQNILEMKPIYNAVFRSRLKEMVERFSLDQNTDGSLVPVKSTNTYKSLQDLMDKKKTMKIAWMPEQYSNLKIDEVYRYFEFYPEGRVNLNS